MNPRLIPLHLFLILLLHFSCSASGYANITVSKTWTMDADITQVQDLNLTGFFIANNSFQRVLSIQSNAQLGQEGETLTVHYSGPAANRTVIYARALVEVHYPQEFQSDPALLPCQSPQPIKISSIASSLSSPTLLPTLAAITEWVYNNLTYDIAYMGKPATPEEVLASRTGVCTHYASIAAAFLDSLCIQHRMVSGYAMQNGTFQPHAWLEADIGENVPMDPTFGEAGPLSAERIISYYWTNSPDDVADSLSFTCSHQPGVSGCNPGAVSMDTSFSAEVLSYRDFDALAKIEPTYEPQSGRLSMNLSNPSSKNLLLTYRFTSAPSTYGQDMRVLSIGPAQSRTFAYPLDTSELGDGFAYTIPYRAQAQGTQCDQSISFSMASGRDSGNPLCQPAFLLLIVSACILYSRKSAK
ncbi:MAG: transglutaminase-like domain-containing protein [Candidatus Micrarchaeia archaeon]